jgi:hypothetical protein
MAYSGVAVVFRYTVSIVSRLDMKCKHTRSSLRCYTVTQVHLGAQIRLAPEQQRLRST